jgi:segregation and condensation protein B
MAKQKNKKQSKKSKSPPSKVDGQEELSVINRDAIVRAANALNALKDNQIDFVEEEVVEDSATEASEDMEIWSEETAVIDESEVSVEFTASEDEDIEIDEETETDTTEAAVEGTELAGFESAEIEDVEFISDDQLQSIIESVLFANDRPVSVAFFRQMFRGTNIKTMDIRTALSNMASDLAGANRGVTLEEVSSGYQLRTKLDNVKFLRGSVKARAFRLSGPALEVLSIVAYKQPVTKAQMDEIRGVESGHLLRALMEKNIVTFGERSELPGKPMFYETTRKFLEIFGLRNVRELPSLHEIDQLIPEGIGDENEKKETLSDLTEKLSETADVSYSQGEEELLKITDELSQITTSSEFFEQEKQRLKDKKEQERAQDIREAIALDEKVEDKEVRWLERYDEAQIAKAKGDAEVAFVTEEVAFVTEEVATTVASETLTEVLEETILEHEPETV